MPLIKGQILEPDKKYRFESLRFEELLQQDAERRDDHFVRLRRNGLPPPRDLPKKEVEIPAEELHRRKLEQIEREAFQRAFAAGEEAGLAMGEQKKQEEIARLLPRFDAIFKHLNRMPARIFAASEQFMVETCIMLLQEIFKHELTVNKASLIARVRKLMDQLSRRDRMEIHLHPEDAEFLKRVPDFSQLTLLADPAMELGSVRLETEFGGIEHDIHVQLREAEQSLREFLNGRLEEIGKGRMPLPVPQEDPWAEESVEEVEDQTVGAEPPPSAQAMTSGQEAAQALPQPERVSLEGLDLSEMEKDDTGLGSLAPAQAHDFLDPSVAVEDDSAVRPAPDDAQEAAWLAELLDGAGSKPVSPTPPAPGPSMPAEAAGKSPPVRPEPEMEPLLDGDLSHGLEGYDLSELSEDVDLGALEFSSVAPVAGEGRPAPSFDPSPDDEEEAAWIGGILESATVKEVPPPELEGFDLSELSAEGNLADVEFSAAPVSRSAAPAPLAEPLPDDEEEAAWIGGILESATTREVGEGKRPEARSEDEDEALMPGTILDASSVTHVPAVSGMGLSQAELNDLLAEPDDAISDDEVAALLAQVTTQGRRRPLSNPLGGSPLGGSPLGRKR